MAEKPIIIKRYENRKLYDTSRSAYVTLEDVARLIREGKEVQVLDAKTNEDLTKSTLALIILDEERQKKNPLPLNLMYQLIKYGEAIQGTFQDYMTTGFEALLAGQLEAQKRMREWVQAGASGAPPAADAREAPAEAASVENELESLKRKMAELERRLKSKKK
jgi:polyhydroxyalkanoate synthesis repressor PhaR